jgi:hypothetical protein
MTISGKRSERRFESSWRIAGLLYLAGGGGLLWYLRTRYFQRFALDIGTELAIVAVFLALGAVFVGFMIWFDVEQVVEFTCDESSFRFRKVRGQAETRALPEVAKVQEVRGRDFSVLGWEVVFLDGKEAFLGRGLPNAKAAADWLSSHRQP